MKTNITIFTILFVLILCACQKEKPVQKELELTDFTITPAGTVAQVALKATYPDKLTATLKISQSEDMTDVTTYMLEKTLTEEEPFIFSFIISNLQKESSYWCQVEVGNIFFNKKTEVVKFTTSDKDLVVTTAEVANIGFDSATCGGSVLSSVNVQIIANGVCWNKTQNPTINDNHTIDGNSFGMFSSSLTNLELNTTYFVRAYAISSNDTVYGDQRTFTTQNGIPTISTSSISNIGYTSAVSGGNVSSNGGLDIIARGVCWSTSHEPTINDDHSLDGSGTGSFTSSISNLGIGTTYYVRAYATNNYITAYGNELSFETTGPPEGAVNGLFTVNSNGDKVWFSMGNLQYNASTNTWRFAENQWDYVGQSNNNASPTYNGWIDIFGWGTSGYDNGQVCFQPWSTSGNHSNYYNGELKGNSDWGYNRISNGGNEEGLWRTPKGTDDGEWNYLLNIRITNSGLRYAKAQVNSINGIILVPDNWNNSLFNLINANNDEAPFNSNIISTEVWDDVFESAGCAFLPAAGERSSASEEYVGNGSNGDYWSSSRNPNLTQQVCEMYFGDSYLHANSPWGRANGYSVRLVQDYQRGK